MSAMRRSNGNMTTVVSLTFGLVIFVWLVGTAINSLLFQRTRDLQNADVIAIKLANTLNAGNRIGQFNQLQADSRELVYVSRQQFESCLSEEPLLAPLADQLLTEARADHQLVRNERTNLSILTSREVQDVVDSINKECNGQSQYLPWLSAKNFQIQQVKFGASKNALSNVAAYSNYPELLQFDLAQGYVDKSSGLFLPQLEVHLPFDSDIRCTFVALPPCVKGTPAAARVISDDLFKESPRTSSRTISTALQVTCGSQVAVSDSHDQSQLKLHSTALTAGASPDE